MLNDGRWIEWYAFDDMDDLERYDTLIQQVERKHDETYVCIYKLWIPGKL